VLMLSNGAVVPTNTTLADRTPMFADANYYGNYALPLLNEWAAYSALYKNQVWVGAIIRKLAFATARMPFDIKIAGKNNDQYDEAGPLTALMRRPNERMSGFALWQWTSSMWDIYGEAFWLKLRDRAGTVRELHPLHPANVVVRRMPDGRLGYIYTAGNRAAIDTLPVFDEDDIVPFVSFNPDTPNRGLSNLESLRMTLLNEDASRRATASFWKRGARPGFLLQHPKTMSEGAQARFKASFNATSAGADNAGGTTILEEGMTAEILQLNLEEMQYIESRKLNREEVCGAYDVPPPALHILDKATFSNITEQLRSVYRDTMAPRFEFMESVVDHHLLPDFYAVDEAFSRFNMDEVLRGDFETRATAAVALRNAGLASGNELRPMFGWAPSDDPAMSEIFANAALVELGSIRGAQPVSTDGELIPQPVKAVARPAVKTPALTVRSIMGRLSRVKASKADTKVKLIQEHQKELDAFFAKQKAAVKAASSTKAAGLLNPGDWDAELAGILGTLAAATSEAIGGKTATDLGGSYDAGRIAPWLEQDAQTSAKNINATTAVQLNEWLERQNAEDEDEELEADTDEFFDSNVAQRSSEISLGRVVMIAGLAALVAAEQSGASSKTWVVTSANPRASHAAMDGETVSLGENFSNGMNGPGDFSGGADEVAGCSCELQFTLEDGN